MNKVFWFLCLCISFTNIFKIVAQSPYIELTGTVQDNHLQSGLAYANIIVKTLDNKVVQTTYSDQEGDFILAVKPKDILVDIEFQLVSYQSFFFKNIALSSSKNLGIIRLTPEVSQLNEVVVTTQKPTLTFERGKKVFTLSNDVTMQSGTATDALNTIPSVQVNLEGKVSLRGNENVRILLDGKPIAGIGNAAGDVLSQFPAQTIEKIEVITSPSAKYQAEGTAGVVNIITKKQKKKGLNATISQVLGVPISSTTAATLNLRTQNINYFTTISRYFKTPPGSISFDNNYNSGSYIRIQEDRILDREDQGTIGTFGFKYQINPKHSVSSSISTRFVNKEDTYTNFSTRNFRDPNLPDALVHVSQHTITPTKNIQWTANYTHFFNQERNHSLSSDFQYAHDTLNKIGNVTDEQDNILISEEQFSNSSKENQYIFQSDYTYSKTDGHKFESGYFGSFRKQDQDYQLQDLNIESQCFELNTDLTNRFVFSEHNHAIYTQWNTKLKKINALFGLRVEYTHMEGELLPSSTLTSAEELLGEGIPLNFTTEYVKLFPNISFTYPFSDDQNIRVSYNYRINRPRSFFVNPFPSRSSDANIFQGNPNLLPVFSGNYEIEYLKEWELFTLNTSVYHQNAKNYFHFIRESSGQTTPEGIEVIRTTPINLDSSERYGLELALNYSAAQKIQVNSSINAFQFVYKGAFNGINYNSKDYGLVSKIQTKIQLPLQSEAQINYNYIAGRRTALTHYMPRHGLNLGLSKTFFSKKCTLTFNVTDVFNTQRRRYTVQNIDFTTNADLQFRSRQFLLTLRYRTEPHKKGRRGIAYTH